MKLEKLDHKHALTSWLKVILFACLMLAPIMSVVVRSLYVVCNKNAKDSYSGEKYKYQQTQLTNDDIELNTFYHFDNFSGTYTNTAQQNTNYLGISEIKNVATGNTAIQTYLPQASYIRFYYSDTTQSIYITDENFNNLTSGINLIQTSLQFDFRLTSITNLSNLEQNITFLSFLDYTNYSPLDNVFDYSISQIEQSQFYNWTQNTAIYNGVQTMTTGLGITGATVPILITYWFLLTIIYIVIDIVLNLFTYITHYLNKKVE